MPEVRRILVAVAPAFVQSPTADFAARLAATIRADIDALLVQDAALMMAADLPFTQEILAPTGARRSLTREALDRDFRALARKLELKLQHSAGRAGLRWNLRSVHGDPIAAIIAAAAENDLLVLGLPRGAALGIATMRRIARQTGRPAVFLGDVSAPGAGLSIFDGDGDLQRELLTIMGPLARTLPGEVTIYGRPSSDADSSRMEDMRRLLGEAQPGLRARLAIIASDMPDVAELRSRTILVLPGRAPDEPEPADPAPR